MFGAVRFLIGAVLCRFGAFCVAEGPVFGTGSFNPHVLGF